MSEATFEFLDEDPLTLAESAYALVQADAARAAELAERAVVLARDRGAREAEVAALHALSFAQHELGDARALRTIRAAVRIGQRHGFERRTALARRRLAFDLANRGAIAPALRELDAACLSLDDHELARTEVFRIHVLGFAGTAPAALESSNRALEILRREGDKIWEARLLQNRGLLLAQRGDLTTAEADLARARDLYVDLGVTEAAFGTEGQLSRIAIARGDLPACLARLDAIDTDDVSPRYAAELELLRAQALAAGRLMGEALRALESAQAIWQRAQIADYEGQLDIVRLTLLAGDPGHARALARRAQRSFAAHRRDIQHARAIGLSLSAAIATGDVPRSAVRNGRRAAATLEAAGWREEAQRVRLTVARAAIELGSPRVARRELAVCASLRSRGPVADRIEARHVEALIRLVDDDGDGAQRAARSGLKLLEEHRAALGASDLRATASAIGVDLARLGLRIALAGIDAGPVLAWAERLRGSALRLEPVTPPNAPGLRDRMTELRQVSAEISRAEQAGRPTRMLVARQARVEMSIRRLARHATGQSTPATTIPSRQKFARALGARALVELIELDGALTALTLVDGRLARHELGLVAPLIEQAEWLRFALARLARRGRSTSAQRAATLAGAEASARALGEQLIAPLAQAVGDRELVIVPTGSMHALPWSALPQLHGRPVAVAPSAVTWLALQVAPARRIKIALIAGPRLRHAAAEASGLGSLYPRATILAGKGATATAVLRALDGAKVAHLACHGRFRADSPLFSSLELADGPLNAYELQRLRRAPDLIVLSACDLAISDTHPGDELLGFAAALLGMGTRTVIASAVPAPDASAKQLMLAMHRHLTAGLSPAVALAKAQNVIRPRESALAGFLCLGTG